MPQTIAELGEQGLLKLLQSYCPREVVGDDAALLTPQPGQQVVVTTDVLVDGVHFSDRTTPPHSAGWRAVAANLSDLAAMGASGLGITVGLSLPADCSVTWVQQLYQGMVDCLTLYDIPIVGGDVCRSEQRAIAITALGQVAPGRAWRRNTAQVGDAIIVTGSHGGARAGLALLLGEDDGARDSLTQSARDNLIYQHQYPQPRLDWVTKFYELAEAIGENSPNSLRLNCITAMDSSDGLADAICQICRASGVGARLNASAIVPPTAMQPWPTKAMDWALYGGEDFQLVVCLNSALAARLGADPSLEATIIGHITSAGEIALQLNNGELQMLDLASGFQHFAAI